MNATVKFLGLVLFPLVILYRLSDRASLRKRNDHFAHDIADAFARLIAEHKGVVTRGEDQRGGVFDYVEAVLTFPDRDLRFVRGRGELTISCDNVLVFSADVDALFQGASFIEKHWNEIQEADSSKVQRWMKSYA